MKKLFLMFFVVGLVALSATPAWAPLVTTFSDDSSSSSSSSSFSDTSTVDLSDRDTSQPTWSPSFENTTPAGQAAGGPIEDND